MRTIFFIGCLVASLMLGSSNYSKEELSKNKDNQEQTKPTCSEVS